MTARLAALLVALAFATWPARAGDAPPAARIVYLSLEDDPHYAPEPSYTGVALKDRHRPRAGVGLGMRDTRVIGRALGVSFTLEDRMLADTEDPRAAVTELLAGGALAVLLDLPEAPLSLIAAAPPTGLMVDLRSRATRWRKRDCAVPFLHTALSRAMEADARAQHLRAQGWQRILLLQGDAPADQTEAEAVEAAAAKFGLRIAERRRFVPGNDPRQRDRNNIALLTGGVRHDVIWLVDTGGDFGRYIPFATQDPRPVVGSEGLGATAWHWTFERYGAPQLNQRFRRQEGRDMTPEDWSGWVAVRAIAEGVRAAGSAEPAAVAAALRAPGFGIDLYKGVRGSFRPWNGQLRQPVLLATHNAVIAVAPLDGYEHQQNTLDTLGLDAPETPCG